MDERGLPEHISEKAKLAASKQEVQRQLYLRKCLSETSPRCPICGDWVNEQRPGELREVFLKSNDVKEYGSETRQAIYTFENCVLVHQGECQRAAATDVGKDHCAVQILAFEGYFQVIRFLLTIGVDKQRSYSEIRYLNDLLERVALSDIVAKGPPAE